jgi:redox-sensitive bicupin YhaK (pirin superfamily)
MIHTQLYPAGTRGHANHGWLDAFHSFSFASFHDPSRVHFGALRVLNDDTVAPGMGFGKHPHDNMEIITIVTEGNLQHKDSMGNVGDIVPGEVQVMSAGTGIYHSEYNPDNANRLKLFQVWIFPETRNVTPRYDQRNFDPSERINKLQTLVSPMTSDDDGLKIHQQAWIYRATLEQGRELQHTMHTPGHSVYAFVVDGKADILGNKLGSKDAMGISATETFSIKADETTDIILLEVPMKI